MNSLAEEELFKNMSIDIKVTAVNGYEPYSRPDFTGGGGGEAYFINRRKNGDALLFVLAGYKSYLYDTVFFRVKNFAPKEMDICIISSGLFDDKLDEIARENSWSYLSTKRNCLTMAQNIAAMLHPKAMWLYKMDEDIFVTKDCFKMLYDTYCKVINDNLYNPIFVAPLIPINGYGHVRILQKLGMTGVYKKLFEPVKYAAVSNRMIGQSAEVAKFFWGENDIIPTIDYMNEEFSRSDLTYRACPIRFSIGFILLHRSMWDAIGGWPVPEYGSGMGMDEDIVNSICTTNSFAMIVSENTVVGHLSFGHQNEAMKEYYLANKDKFTLRS